MTPMSGGQCLCSYCGEQSQATIRQRSVGEPATGTGFSYRHHAWRCSGCGREWEDDIMRRTNEMNASIFEGFKP
jgi:hypothetical protein